MRGRTPRTHWLCRSHRPARMRPQNTPSEHPPALVSTGQAYVTTLINSIMRSPCWSSTAIFLSWDDWGGFYDYIVPPPIDENGYGFRVPGLVISPYLLLGCNMECSVYAHGHLNLMRGRRHLGLRGVWRPSNPVTRRGSRCPSRIRTCPRCIARSSGATRSRRRSRWKPAPVASARTTVSWCG